jgi:hypothetical protein
MVYHWVVGTDDLSVEWKDCLSGGKKAELWEMTMVDWKVGLKGRKRQ